MTIRVAGLMLALLLIVSLGRGSPMPLPPPAFETIRPGVVRLTATAGIWLADTTPSERNSSAGRVPVFKLKSIQEMAAIRFDARAIQGREVHAARLFLHPAGATLLRYLRVSTVSQNWEAGASRHPYGRADGATYSMADASQGRAWSFPGSEFADVVMGSGFTITTYSAIREEMDGWVSIALTPDLVYALVAEQSDGLAVMDGGTPANANNMIDGAGAGRRAPYIEVELGESLEDSPGVPRAVAVPAPAHAHLTTGAMEIAIEPDPAVFCWRVEVDGTPVPRWRIPYPSPVARGGREQDHLRGARAPGSGPVVFHLDDLEPLRVYTIAIAAVARGGATSPPVHLHVSSSAAAAAPAPLDTFAAARRAAAPAQGGGRFEVWAVPGLIKISPERGTAMFDDMAGDGGGTAANAVWDGQRIQLFGGRGEYVSFQLVISRVERTPPLADVRVQVGELTGPGGSITEGNIELFKNWYARNREGQWQPAYVLPWQSGQAFAIPDPQRALGGQRNQSMYVDVYIPKYAAPGHYTGRVTVAAGGGQAILPIELDVYDFALPDALSFWPELNSYSRPSDHLDYHRLAHQHRLVFNPWINEPATRGSGRDIEVLWDDYDAAAAPLLSGEAFKSNRRAGVPTPVMYLPFEDSWPTPLSPRTYHYARRWPGQGDPLSSLVEHYMTAPYIGEGLSQGYQDAFFAVQRQFVEHFRERGWNRTEMQLFYGGKNTHRLDYGSNMWWTTDEPYLWDDWLAVQFFAGLWVQGRRALNADPAVWSVRADLSRPMWTGRVLDTIVDHAYWGGFTNDRWYRRAAWLAEETGLGTRAYGSANLATASNSQTVSTLLQVWLHGANAFLPWQTLGDDASLDINDNLAGNTLLVPGTRFGVPVVGDLRLKALRDGEQIIEYLVILMEREGLSREQLAALLAPLSLSAAGKAGASQDDADAGRYNTLRDWQIAGLRRALADRIVATRGAPSSGK